jgi:hypothetical protein
MNFHLRQRVAVGKSPLGVCCINVRALVCRLLAANRTAAAMMPKNDEFGGAALWCFCPRAMGARPARPWVAG